MTYLRFLLFSRDDRIRTCDHTTPSRVRYRTAPHPDFFLKIQEPKIQLRFCMLQVILSYFLNSVWSEIQHFQIKFFLQNLCFFYSFDAQASTS